MTTKGHQPDAAPAYTVHLNRMDGRYFLHIRELNLIVEDDDLTAAYDELERRKRDVIDKFVRLGREREIPQPEEAKTRSETRKALTPFFIKAAVVALVGGLLVATANISIIYTLQTAPRHLAVYANRVFVRNFAREFEKLQERDMTPERQAKIREAIRKAVPILRPYAVELRPLFQEALGPSG